MASQTLRPHRSPSPSPSPTPVNPANPAKLTRQSLGPPPAASGTARGFGGLGVASPTFPSGTGGIGAGPHPRHVSSSVALGLSGSRDSMTSSRPSLGTPGNRAVSGAPGPRPSSEFLPSGLTRDTRTPEAEQIDQWFKHLASWEQTLEEMAAASTDQNFTEELGAIEQWFRVLSEAERTAALYSLLQHSTPVQIRFFLSVLHHMAQQDPMTALLSPNPVNAAQAGLQAQMEQKLASMNLKSPSAGGGSGFPGSPTVNQYLAPESAMDSNGLAAKKGRNRISAPGTLQPSDRWQGNLDQVIERGTSPGADSASNRSGSPAPEMRPKSADFSGKARESDGRSPRLSGGAAGSAIGLGIGAPVDHIASPVASPFLNSGSWASMSNTPLVPMFTDPKVDNLQAALNLANLQMAATGQPGGSRVNLEDARKFRRPGAGQPGNTSRNVSGNFPEDVQSSPLLNQQWGRSPVIDQFGLGGLGIGGAADQGLAGLGMNFANLGLGGLANANAAQMLALAQAQQQLNTAAAFGQGNFGGQPGGLGSGMRGIGRGPQMPPGRRSPMLGKSHSPAPAQGGGGAGSGGGVAGPDDVDDKVLRDPSQWLRVLRLHKYTTNFERSNWQEMVLMTDADLQDKGVAAQGARTKFLKVFHNVRENKGIAHPPGQEEYAQSASKSEEKKD